MGDRFIPCEIWLRGKGCVSHLLGKGNEQGELLQPGKISSTPKWDMTLWQAVFVKSKKISEQVPKAPCRILWRQEKTQVGKEVSMNSNGFIIILQRGRVHKRDGQIWDTMSLSSIYITTSKKTKSISFLTFLGGCLAMEATKQTKKSCRASLLFIFQKSVLCIPFIIILLTVCICSAPWEAVLNPVVMTHHDCVALRFVRH